VEGSAAEKKFFVLAEKPSTRRNYTSHPGDFCLHEHLTQEVEINMKENGLGP
jgi:hypothetical protein